MRIIANWMDFSEWRETAAKEFPTIDYVVTEIDQLPGLIAAERLGDDTK